MWIQYLNGDIDNPFNDPIVSPEKRKHIFLDLIYFKEIAAKKNWYDI